MLINSSCSLPLSLVVKYQELGLTDRQLVLLLALSSGRTYADLAESLGYKNAAALKAQVAKIPHIKANGSSVDADLLITKAAALDRKAGTPAGSFFAPTPSEKPTVEDTEIESVYRKLVDMGLPAGTPRYKQVQQLLNHYSPEDILGCAHYVKRYLDHKYEGRGDVVVPTYDYFSMTKIQNTLRRWIHAGRPTTLPDDAQDDLYKGL